jgi:hypothetical protein
MKFAAQHDTITWSDCLAMPEVKEHEPRRDDLNMRSVPFGDSYFAF